MLWGPETWDTFALRGSVQARDGGNADKVLRRRLRGIPGRPMMTVADLGCGDGRLVPFLASHFGRVVAIDYAPATLALAREQRNREGVSFRRRDLRDLTPFRHAFDVAVAVDSILGPRPVDVDRILGQILQSLKEGGIVLATFPAAERRGAPVPMALGEAPSAPRVLAFHEMEIQYRLRRAGFRAIRIRRFPGDDTRTGTLLCQATRRAQN